MVRRICSALLLFHDAVFGLRADPPRSVPWEEGWYRSKAKQSCNFKCENGGLICDEVALNAAVEDLNTKEKFESMYSKNFRRGKNFSCKKFTITGLRRAPFVFLAEADGKPEEAKRCVAPNKTASCDKKAKIDERRLCYCSAPPPSPPTPPPAPSPMCGAKGKIPSSNDVSINIVNGRDADPCEWVWQVSLQQPIGKHRCGGVLLHPDWVLTARHCVTGLFFNVRTVVVGEYNRAEESEHKQVRQVKKVITPTYQLAPGEDIALLQLNTSVTLGDCVGIPCLPDEEIAADSKCMITGWGKTSASGRAASILQEAKMKIVDLETCKEMWSRRGKPPQPTSGHVCIGPVGKKNSSACYGDSGGPLVCKTNSRWTVYGVTSRGAGGNCSATPYPNLYTSTHYYNDWIQDALKS